MNGPRRWIVMVLIIFDLQSTSAFTRQRSNSPLPSLAQEEEDRSGIGQFWLGNRRLDVRELRKVFLDAQSIVILVNGVRCSEDVQALLPSRLFEFS